MNKPANEGLGATEDFIRRRRKYFKANTRIEETAQLQSLGLRVIVDLSSPLFLSSFVSYLYFHNFCFIVVDIILYMSHAGLKLAV